MMKNMRTVRKRALSIALALFVCFTSCAAGSVPAVAASKKTGKISLNCKRASTYAGGTVKLSAKSGKKPAKVTWTSSNRKLATVSSKGKVKAKKAGTVTITAKSKSAPKSSAKCKIKIYKATKKISLSGGGTYDLEKGQSVTLRVKVTKPAKGAQPVRWTSKNPTVAKVTAGGKVTAMAKGRASVTGQSGKKKVSVEIRVTEKSADGDRPDIPNKPDKPDVPDKPDQPDVPDQPDNPDNPDIPDGPAPGPSGGATRADWTAALTEKLGYSVKKENLLLDGGAGEILYEYDDIDGHANAMDIEAAYCHGILPPVDTDGGTERLFLPDEPATREFAAMTAVRALGFVSEGALESSDSGTLAYPEEDRTAVELGMLSLKDGAFLPEYALTEDEKNAALAVVDAILSGRAVDENHEDAVAYADGENMADWTGALPGGYRLEQKGEDGSFSLSAQDMPQAETLKEGDIIELPASKEYPAGAFLKAQGVERGEGGAATVTGTIPEVSEVFRSVDIEGVAGAYLDGIVPAEGVAFSRADVPVDPVGISTGGIQNKNLGLSLKVSCSGGKITMEAGSFSLESEWKDPVINEDESVEYSFEFRIPNIRYSLDADFGNPLAPKLNGLYLEAPNAFVLSGQQSGEKEYKQKICTATFPMGYGFSASFGIYLVCGVQGSFKVCYSLEGTAGVQYAGGRVQNISRYSPVKTSMEMECEAKIGLSPEISLNFAAWKDLYSVAAEAGVKAASKLVARSDTDLCCADIRAWVYGDVSVGKESFFGNLLGLKYAWSIYGESNSPYRKNPLCHLENDKRVEECTYGKGKVTGGVRDTDGKAIAGCTVTIASEGKIVSRVKTGADGGYSAEIPAGNYTVSYYKKNYDTATEIIDLKPQGEAKLSLVLEGPLSGEFCGIEWKIDKNRTLTLKGECEREFSWHEVPWHKNKDGIRSAKVAVTGLTNMAGMFSEYANLETADFTGTDTRKVTDMGGMFYSCTSLTSLDVSGFDTRNVTYMGSMFFQCENLTSLDVSGFDTGNITNMMYMFYGCSGLKQLDVSEFDTGRVEDMESIFGYCKELTSLDVSGFDTRNVMSMIGMFVHCENLTSLDVSGFDTGNITNMMHMFYGCSGLKQLDVSEFDTGRVKDMESIFGYCEELTSLDVSGFDTGNVEDMSGMFAGCRSLACLDVSGFDTGNVEDMSSMFQECSSLTSLDVSGFDTKNVTDMGCMFMECHSLANLDILNFDTSKVTDMWHMFHECHSLSSLNLQNFNTVDVTNMSGMFSRCSNLTSLDVSGFDTKNVTDMGYMFMECHSLANLDIRNFDTSKVTDMMYMFHECHSLASLNLQNFNTVNVTNMYGMFCGCSSLRSLNISNFNINNVTQLDVIFDGCENLKAIQFPPGWPANAVPPYEPWIEI